MKIDKKTRKLLMTARAGLLMVAKAIEEYCREEEPPMEVKITEQDTVTLT